MGLFEYWAASGKDGIHLPRQLVYAGRHGPVDADGDLSLPTYGGADHLRRSTFILEIDEVLIRHDGVRTPPWSACPTRTGGARRSRPLSN